MTLADIFAVGSLLAYKGKEYRIGQPGLVQQGQFQRWLEQRAHDAVDRSDASEDAKDRRHARIDTDAALGKYEYDGPYAQEALYMPAGMAKMLEIIGREEGITPEVAEGMVREKIKEVAAVMLRARISDPKVLAQAIASLGLPSEWAESGPSEPSCSNSSSPPSGSDSTTSEASPTSNSPSTTPAREAPAG